MEPAVAEGAVTHPPAPEWCIGWVYLIGTPIQYQKIGFSTEPLRRVREFTRLPFDVWVEHSFPVGTRNVETRLHEFFKPRRARGEWFSLGSDGVALVKGIKEARSNAALPFVGRYAGSFTPAAITPSWKAVSNAFAVALMNLRVRAGLSHEGLAARCGLPAHVVIGYETSALSFLSWHEVQRLADALGVPTDAFRGTGR